MAHLDSIRKDMVILEKSEFANLRSENTVRPRHAQPVHRLLPSVTHWLWRRSMVVINWEFVLLKDLKNSVLSFETFVFEKVELALKQMNKVLNWCYAGLAGLLEQTLMLINITKISKDIEIIFNVCVLFYSPTFSNTNVSMCVWFFKMYFQLSLFCLHNL